MPRTARKSPLVPPCAANECGVVRRNLLADPGGARVRAQDLPEVLPTMRRPSGVRNSASMAAHVRTRKGGRASSPHHLSAATAASPSGNQPPLRPADGGQGAAVQVDVREAQLDQLGHAQPRGVQSLQHGPVARTVVGATIGGCHQPKHSGDSQVPGQRPAEPLQIHVPRWDRSRIFNWSQKNLKENWRNATSARA